MAQFRELYKGINVNSCVVIIPGVGGQGLHDWGTGSCNSWLKTLSSVEAKRCRFLLFEHKLKLDQSFSWLELLSCGSDLLDALLRLYNGNVQHPILFICHSLGGIIAKQALWQARQQDHYRCLERVTSGIIFLGTPHSRLTNEPRWKLLIQALNPIMRNAVKIHSTIEDVSILAKLSTQFEEINSQLPILTIYENNDTKFRDRHRFRYRQAMLVGKDFSLINARYEESHEIETDYFGLCNFDNTSDAYNKICKFFQSSLKTAESKLSLGRSSYEQAVAPGSFRVASHTFDIIRSPNQGKSALMTSWPADIPVNADYGVSCSGPHLPCYIFKSHVRNVRFYGRSKELLLLDKSLLPSNLEHQAPGGLKSFAVCGLGGVGKTELAVEFMFRHQHRYDAIFWLQADEPSKLAEEFAQIAVKLGLEEVDDAFDQEVSRNLVKSWLAKPIKSLNPNDHASMSEAKWLLVFDNVESPEILKDFWPSFGVGSILITSRDPFAKNQVFAPASGIDLYPFDTDGAARFLIKLTSEQGVDDQELLEEATEIANRLGGLPLAITQMAGIINSRAISLAEFLEMFHEGMTKEYHRLLMDPRARGYEHSLASVWAFERLDPGPSALLDVLSLLDSGPIGELILQAGAAAVYLEGYPKTHIAYQDSRSVLIHKSLITRNTRSKMLLVHRMTQAVARHKMDLNRFEAAFEAAVVLISEVWRSEPLHKRYDTTQWRELEAILPHVLSLHLLCLSQKQAFIPTVRFARLLNNVGWYFHERGKSDDHSSSSELAQWICESQAIQDERVHRILIDIHYSRGSEASQTNQPALCLKQFNALLALCRKVCDYSREGQPNEDLASAHNEVGVAYMMNKMYVDGMKAFKKSIDIYQTLEGYTKTMISFPLVNLGLSFWLQGRYLEATQVLQEALQHREEAFGPDDKESLKTGRILHALGNVCASQDELDESFDFHRRALVQYRSTIGHSHHRTADVCHKVAEHYIRLRQYESARKLLEQALRVYSSRTQLNPEKARTSFVMGRLLLQSGNNTEAHPFLEDARILYCELRPEDTRAQEELTGADFDDIVSWWTK